jgi:hypothetical protein
MLFATTYAANLTPFIVLEIVIFAVGFALGSSYQKQKVKKG